MAIIEENCHGPPKPGGGEDQIKSVIAVDITRHDLQAADRSDDLKGLLPCGTELQLNEIGRAG